MTTRRDFVVGGTLACLLPRLSFGAPSPTLVGKDLPFLELSDGQEGVFSWDRFAGKTLLINFWAMWCRPCIKELPALDRLHRRLEKDGLAVLAVCVDEMAPASAVLETMRQKGFVMPIAFESTGVATRLFKLETLPTSLVVDAKGVVQHVVVGAQDWDNEQWTSGLRKLAKEA